MLVEILIF
ncbi:hypothetical protein F383_36211 [Gossypium arboreum]|uniref:Uncharacterized protein n=1 Tax=Gossypium arboreum TaxID=29729 RepID=A0A0B0PGU6_GOSAR|nr:hypothetical protein F383_22937 [Gossypium arboreum]KHG17306.1 hypothetical protein F383_20819 [Gossypium arboreum]KHG18947.1 hypothetical protein F383_24868 [Gossypium arboreum]KHG19945.1 hypothetical protein F383_26047 [Gossypium arboreum]KHG21867.1 hypothetical protein F383_02501 [Gossypium arboreum]